MECHSETREQHSITYKPIIAPEQHPIYRNTHPKTNRTPLGAACVESIIPSALFERKTTSDSRSLPTELGNRESHPLQTDDSYGVYESLTNQLQLRRSILFVEIRILKTNRVPLGAACVESYHLHCLDEKQQQTTGRYLRSQGIGNHRLATNR